MSDAKITAATLVTGAFAFLGAIWKTITARPVDRATATRIVQETYSELVEDLTAHVEATEARFTRRLEAVESDLEKANKAIDECHAERDADRREFAARIAGLHPGAGGS